MSLGTRPSANPPARREPAPVTGDGRTIRLASVGLLCALLAWALAPLLYLLHRAGPGERLTGADSIFPGDQLQYMAWIRSAGTHLLAADDFVLRQGAHDFLHPMFVISALLWRIGLPLPISYLIWVPIGVIVLFEGYRRYVWRMLVSGRGRLAALALALFFVTPLDPIVGWTVGSNGLGTISGELAPTGSLWGYLPVTISTGLLPLAILGLERAATAGEEAGGSWVRPGIAVTLLAGIAAWLHPWQGEVFLAVSLLLCLARRSPAMLATAALSAVGPVAAIAYYLLLARTDPTWDLARTQSTPPHPSVLLLVVALAPLVVWAPIEIRRLRHEPRTTADQLLLVWPVATLLVYFATPEYSLHALEGLALPLSVIAVRAWRRLALPVWLAVAAIAAATVPGLVFDAQLLHTVTRQTLQGLVVTRDEARALDYLADQPDTGGVLPSLNVAPEVPALGGQRTWLGHPIWTPRYPARAGAVSTLFGGGATMAAAVRLVRESGARYVLSDCQAGFTPRLIAPLHPEVRRFGCVVIYTIPGAPAASSL